MSAPSRLALFLIAGLLAGCASTSAPRGWLPSVEEAAQDGYGAWIRVRFHDDRPVLLGELIEVGDSAVTVLDLTGQVQPAGRSDIREARVATYQSQAGRYGLWAALGSVATISNGAYLLFTFPAWLGTGAEAVRLENASPLVDYPGVPWAALRPHARFPQGLPPGVDPAALRPRSPGR